MLWLARVRTAASDAYRSAIEIAPTSAMAYSRLGTVQARLADAMGDAEQNASITTFEHAWHLQRQEGSVEGKRRTPQDSTEASAAFARRRVDMALAGVGAREALRPVHTVRELSVVEADAAPGATRRAVSLWRSQGLVIFPALLDVTKLVRAIRADAALSSTRSSPPAASVDRTAHIRAPANRTLRALSVTHSAAVLAALASKLDGFLGEALQSRSHLVLEIGLMGAMPGASDQGWHRDDGILDSRVASIQIALVDTDEEQGALEVQPGSHSHTGKPDAAAGVAIGVPAGSVTVYSPNVVHRGRANTRGERPHARAHGHG